MLLLFCTKGLFAGIIFGLPRFMFNLFMPFDIADPYGKTFDLSPHAFLERMDHMKIDVHSTINTNYGKTDFEDKFKD